MGSLRRDALVRRGIGELYVMVIIIVILIIALTIMYTVMSGFTKYMMEQKQEIVKLESAKASLKTGLKSLTCGGGSCIVTVGVSGTTIITGSKAVCVLSSTVMNVTSPCNYALGNDWSVEVAIPSELISDANSIVGSGGYSYITIYLPGSDGLVPSIALYMGYVIAYAVLNSTGNYAVIVVNNSTGWINATLLVNNQPYSSHVVSPTGSYVFTNVPSGTYMLSINNIINEPIQTIQPSTYSYTVQQCASLRAPRSYSYSLLALPHGSYYVTYNGVVEGYSDPTYMNVFTQGFYSYYVYLLYYPYQGTISGIVSLYPTDFTINETIFFAFVILKNNTAIVAYWPSNTYPQSSAATGTSNTLNIIGQALQNARFPGVNVNNVEFIEVNPPYENTWLSYSFSCTPSICKYIGFGIGVFTASNSMSQGAAYWCVR